MVELNEKLSNDLSTRDVAFIAAGMFWGFLMRPLFDGASITFLGTVALLIIGILAMIKRQPVYILKVKGIAGGVK